MRLQWNGKIVIILHNNRNCHGITKTKTKPTHKIYNNEKMTIATRTTE